MYKIHNKIHFEGTYGIYYYTSLLLLRHLFNKATISVGM